MASGGYRHEVFGEPSSAKNVGSSVSFLFAGVATVCACAIARFLGGFAVWPLGAFVATLAYLFLFGVEVGLSKR